ncbi:Hsp20/alpha crystallin family protein [Patescibacteria group bacterium]|nr:Hsp20/alpha crystallin family protein [Patescibacteria group bacterium]MBU0964056.1 Hsp20/alpha crystallin family protein [Patescibacteria group bacterium]
MAKKEKVATTKEKEEYQYSFANDTAGKAAQTQASRALAEPANTGDWLEAEDYAGQLAVDVFQTKDDIIIKSTIAGVKPEDIDISINNDMITLRGKRERDHQVTDEDYYYRECYWGGFSRSIILPCDVKVDKIQASMKNGVLSVVLPKATKVSKVTVVRVKEE